MMKGPAKVSRWGESLKDTSLVCAARILVIEDNGSDVFLLDRALKKQDFPFELVHLLNGGEGLAFIRRQGAYADVAIPNLILVDLNLSKYTGEDILREIRSATHLAGVPVCVELFPVAAGRGAAERPRSFSIHNQAFRPGSVHGDRQDHQESADSRGSPLIAARRWGVRHKSGDSHSATSADG